MGNIYIPREFIDRIESECHQASTGRPEVKNKVICVKIPYKGYEISLSLDSSLGDGDLFRGDIRVYTDPGSVPGVDCTSEFFEPGECMLYGTAATLKHIMLSIDAREKD